jgi:hypothetical protein
MLRAFGARKSRLSAPEVSRTFEVVCDDGRKAHRQAKDIETLRKILQRDWTITGQVFAGGYVVPLDGPSPMFDGWIQAHGPRAFEMARRTRCADTEGRNINVSFDTLSAPS